MDTNTDERMTILKMIEDQKITAERGVLLLDAIGKPDERVVMPHTPAQPKDLPLPTNAVPQVSRTNRRFRILVTDTVTGKNKVSVTLPLGLMRWGLRTGMKYSGENSELNMNELADLLESGEDGQIVEVFDEEDGEHVRIFIE